MKVDNVRMQTIGNILEKFEIKKSSITSKRQMLLKDFVENLNLERSGSKYPPLTGKVVAIKLFHLSEFDLSAFYSSCKDAQRRNGSFSKYFWYNLRIKPKNENAIQKNYTKCLKGENKIKM